MKSEQQDFLLARCEHCRRQFNFNASDLGFTTPCPFCEQPTPLQEDSTPAAERDRRKPPVWLVWMLTVCAASLLLTFAMVAMVNWIPTLSMAALWQVYGWYMFAVIFISLCSAGLWIFFLVYVFVSLTEMRASLREIAANTSAARMPPPKPPEQRSESAWSTIPKPLSAAPSPEEQKYMPKA